MNLLPLPTRLPARKHVLAASLVLLSVSLMAAAVLGATGLPSPFRSGGAQRVSTNGVVIDSPNETTTTTPTDSTLKVPETPRGVAATPTTIGPASSGTSDPPQSPATTTTTVIPGAPNIVDQLLGGGGTGQGQSSSGLLGGS